MKENKFSIIPIGFQALPHTIGEHRIVCPQQSRKRRCSNTLPDGSHNCHRENRQRTNDDGDTHDVSQLADTHHFIIACRQDPGRPAANHPWRLDPIGKARYQSANPKESAELWRAPLRAFCADSICVLY